MLITKPSRLWGVWDCAFFGSGTTIVRLKEQQHKPHLYIYADKSISEGRYIRDRYDMCYQLCDYMNNGLRPKWLDDFDRIEEGYAMSLSGGSIQACGPMIDKNPPNLFWVWDDSDDAVNDRVRLMDALFLRNK